MTVICFEGKPRTGKTLGMSIWAYDALVRRHEIFSNYTLKFSQHPKMDIFDILSIPMNDVERNPKTLCIQEADKIFDSWVRNNDMRLLSSLTGQSGKRNLNIYYDTQFFERVQKSLRRVTEYKVKCSSYIRSDNKEPIAFEWVLGESIGNDEFQFVNKITLPVTTKINGYTVKEYYDLYDSYEVTAPYEVNSDIPASD